jgi:hypothetical protein
MSEVHRAHILEELQEAKIAEEPNKVNPTIETWSAITAEDEGTM